MNWNEILSEVLSYALYAVIIALVPVLIVFVRKIADTLVDYLNSKVDNTVLQQVMKEIVTFTSDAVAYTAQTYVDSLKKNGEFTEEAQSTAFNLAKETALAFISTESKELFESVYGSLEEYIRILIEKEVRIQKVLIPSSTLEVVDQVETK